MYPEDYPGTQAQAERTKAKIDEIAARAKAEMLEVAARSRVEQRDPQRTSGRVTTANATPRTVAKTDLRVSDAEREAVATLLGKAMSEGRLTVAEFEERLAQVYMARTYGQLEPIAADLPKPPPPHPPAWRLLIGFVWSLLRYTAKAIKWIAVLPLRAARAARRSVHMDREDIYLVSTLLLALNVVASIVLWAKTESAAAGWYCGCSLVICIVVCISALVDIINDDF